MAVKLTWSLWQKVAPQESKQEDESRSMRGAILCKNPTQDGVLDFSFVSA
jgi:hypothetical protein